MSVPPGLVRAALAAAWRLHAVPAAPQLFDLVMRLPVMATGRAREELGWVPRYTALEAIEEFLDGLRSGAGLPTAPLAPDGVLSRLREVVTGVGERDR